MPLTTTKRRAGAGLPLLITSFLFVGCSTQQETGGTGTTQATPQPTASTTTQTSSTNAATTATPSTPTTSAPAIATADGDTPNVRAEVQELKRSGDTATLKFIIINGSEKRLDFGYAFGDDATQTKDYNTIGGVHLIDANGKKKYFVVRDTESNCVCSRGLRDIEPGGRANLWAKFPAPPEDVQKISVVIPHFGPMDDVPISR